VKILYIEDNRENRMLVRAVLEAAGYHIVDAEDGLAGIEAAIREEPALILLDINLPGVDGYEIVAILKSFPNLATTPVIAVTAYAMQGDRQRTLVAGCDGYIQKPIDVDAFPRQVAEFLGGKRERVESHDEGVYLRELNQRLVYRLLNQVEELKRLNQHFVRRASQLEDLHRSMEDITAELGVAGMLEKLLGGLARAIGSTSLSVELSEPPGVQVSVRRDTEVQPRSVLAGSGVSAADDWTEVEWRLPLTVRGRPLGVMIARHVLPPGAKADEEQLLKIVADQVAIAVENARLYEGVKLLHEETQERLRHTERCLRSARTPARPWSSTRSCAARRARWCERSAPTPAVPGCRVRTAAASCRSSAITSLRRSWGAGERQHQIARSPRERLAPRRGARVFQQQPGRHALRPSDRPAAPPQVGAHPAHALEGREHRRLRARLVQGPSSLHAG
jgi:CheY-like chemotaxis protein